MAPAYKSRKAKANSRPKKKVTKFRKRTITEISTKTKTRPRPLVLGGQDPAKRSPELASAQLSLTTTSVLKRLARPALFWTQDSFAFRIAESLALLHSDRNPSIFERIGWIHDINETIEQAHLSLLSDDDNSLARAQLEQLKQSLENFKRANANQVRLALLSLVRRPVPSSTELQALQNWYQPIYEILQLAHGVADEYGFGADWKQISDKTRSLYLEKSKSVSMASDDSDSSINLVRPTTARTLSSVPTKAVLRLTPLTASATAAEVSAVINDILLFYRRQTEDSGADANVSYQDIRTIAQAASVLLLPGPNEEPCLLAKFVPQETRILLSGWCNRFSYVWSSAAQADLEHRFQKITQDVSQSSGINFEGTFLTLAEDLETLKTSLPSDISLEEWNMLVPLLTGDSDFDRAAIRLSHLYASYQEQTYLHEEMTRLWLNIWRSLKATYILLRSNDFRFPSNVDSDNQKLSFVDVAFFSQADILDDLKLVLSRPEVASTQVIDDLVGKYCQLVVNCYENVSSNLQSLYGNGISERLYEEVDQYCRQPSWNLAYSFLLHRMVLRMAKVLGGVGKMLRRNSELGSRHHSPLSIVDASFPTIDISISPSDAVSDYPTANMESADGRTNDISADSAVGWDQRFLRSAFPYVRMPFSDTRATQVMESRQVAREMATSEIRSEGPRESDVVNITPRHVTLSPRARLSWGITDIVRGILRLRSLPRQTRLARIPGRLPSENLLAPILDANNRVEKRRRSSRPVERSTRKSGPHSPGSSPSSDKGGSGKLNSNTDHDEPLNDADRDKIPIFEDETATDARHQSSGSPRGRDRAPQPFTNRIDPDEPLPSIEHDDPPPGRGFPWSGLCHPCPSNEAEWHHDCSSSCPGWREAILNGELTCHPCPIPGGLGWHHICGLQRPTGAVVRCPNFWLARGARNPPNRPDPNNEAGGSLPDYEHSSLAGPSTDYGPSPDYGPSSDSQRLPSRSSVYNSAQENVPPRQAQDPNQANPGTPRRPLNVGRPATPFARPGISPLTDEEDANVGDPNVVANNAAHPGGPYMTALEAAQLNPQQFNYQNNLYPQPYGQPYAQPYGLPHGQAYGPFYAPPYGQTFIPTFGPINAQPDDGVNPQTYDPLNALPSKPPDPLTYARTYVPPYVPIGDSTETDPNAQQGESSEEDDGQPFGRNGYNADRKCNCSRGTGCARRRGRGCKCACRGGNSGDQCRCTHCKCACNVRREGSSGSESIVREKTPKDPFGLGATRPPPPPQKTNRRGEARVRDGVVRNQVNFVDRNAMRRGVINRSPVPDVRRAYDVLPPSIGRSNVNRNTNAAPAGVGAGAGSGAADANGAPDANAKVQHQDGRDDDEERDRDGARVDDGDSDSASMDLSPISDDADKPPLPLPNATTSPAPPPSPTPQPHLPTQEAYARMTVPELRAELLARGVVDAAVRKLRLKKDLIAKLMEEDRRGNTGNGAGRRRNLAVQRGEGDPGARRGGVRKTVKGRRG